MCRGRLDASTLWPFLPPSLSPSLPPSAAYLFRSYKSLLPPSSPAPKQAALLVLRCVSVVFPHPLSTSEIEENCRSAHVRGPEKREGRREGGRKRGVSMCVGRREVRSKGGREAGREGGKAYLQKHGHLVTLPFVSLLLGLCLREEAGVLVLPLRFLLDEARREGGREGGMDGERSLLFRLCLREKASVLVLSLSFLQHEGRRKGGIDFSIQLTTVHPALPSSLPPSLPPSLLTSSNTNRFSLFIPWVARSSTRRKSESLSACRVVMVT